MTDDGRRRANRETATAPRTAVRSRTGCRRTRMRDPRVRESHEPATSSSPRDAGTAAGSGRRNTRACEMHDCANRPSLRLSCSPTDRVECRYAAPRQRELRPSEGQDRSGKTGPICASADIQRPAWPRRPADLARSTPPALEPPVVEPRVIAPRVIEPQAAPASAAPA